MMSRDDNNQLPNIIFGASGDMEKLNVTIKRGSKLILRQPGGVYNPSEQVGGSPSGDKTSLPALTGALCSR